MCVAAIAWDAHPDFLLVAVGNRDEFHDRPAAPLARWDDGSGIVAGRDLRSGGTWLGVSEAGRFSLLTNFRNPRGANPDSPSRGAVVPNLLSGSEIDHADRMNPFNAVLVTQDTALFLTNFPRLRRARLDRGVHGLSNGALDRPWPKTRQLCGDLETWLSGRVCDTASLFEALRAQTPVSEHPVPDDGPQPDFAPVFIRNPVYGTRCSSVLTVRRDGRGLIEEHTFDRNGRAAGQARVPFAWPM